MTVDAGQIVFFISDDLRLLPGLVTGTAEHEGRQQAELLIYTRSEQRLQLDAGRLFNEYTDAVSFFKQHHPREELDPQDTVERMQFMRIRRLELFGPVSETGPGPDGDDLLEVHEF